MMWWAMWCAAVLVGSVASAPASDAMPPLDLAQIDPSTSDDESISYGVPPMGTRYDNSAAPWLYLLAEMPRESQSPDESERARVKRRMPSLSIDLPMSLLRQRLTQEKERRVHALRAVANRNFLNDIGKRGFQWAPAMKFGNTFN